MFIFGKNNNHLIKNNHKKTFSFPQKIKVFQKQLIKCVCGYDFIIMLTKKQSKTFCYYQSAIYSLEIKQKNNIKEKIIDIATDDGLIMLITDKGQLYATDFDGDKLINGELKPKKMNINISFQNLQNKLKQIFMSNGQIYIKFNNNLIAYLKRNHWIQTKTFSDPQLLETSKTKNIINIDCNHQKFNLFLTNDGSVLLTQKNTPFNLQKIDLKQKVIKFAVNNSQIYTINTNGQILKITNLQQKTKIKVQKISKMTTKFIDLRITDQNFYAITQSQQVWVWGKNSNGQLGLSDYQPRSSLYPMISLEKFYVKHIYIGQQYTCCQVQQSRTRDQNSTSQRSNWLSSVRVQPKKVSSQSVSNQNINLMSSIQRVEKIQYNQTESKQQILDISVKKDKENIIINKRVQPKKVTKNKQKTNNKSYLELSKKSCLNNSVSSCKSNYCACNNNLSVSRSKSNNGAKEIRPVSRSKSIRKNDVSARKNDNNLPSSKSNNKNEKVSVHKYITPSKKQNLKPSEINNKSSKPKIQLVYETHRLQLGKLQDKIIQLQRQLRLTNQQKRDLFQLVKQKNQIIQDITSKIALLQQAIQQHQKTLSARDYEAEDFYLKQKQYQLHIANLESQVQKMMLILNKNQNKNEEKYRQTQIYHKQMERMKFQIKNKIQGEKQYYRERIKSIQRKFQEQKNLYQIQIQNLQEEVQKYKSKQVQLMNKLSNRNQLFFCQNTPSLQSPSFNTLDIKTSFRNRIFNDQSYRIMDDESKITLNNNNNNSYISYPQNNSENIFEEQKYVLQEKNKYPDQNKNNTSKPNKNISAPISNYGNENNEYQVNAILQKIEKNKNYISKSANKLVHILQNDNI